MFDSVWDFEGRWYLERAILHANGQRATLTGRAVFTRHSDALFYHETGTLCVKGQAPCRAERRYRWVPIEAGSIDVFFEDGREFHRIDQDAPRARHDCGSDTYHVEYDFDDWPIWRAVWRVTGPQKDYTLTSNYRPLPPA
ncbi:MAG: DUF6314 family protein [Pseudomonadota bacterium]